MYNKEAKLKLETSAHYIPIGKTNIVFYDSDIGTADLVFYITRNKRPLEVSNENVDCYVILKAKDGSYIVDKMYVEDPLNGKVRFTIPKEFLSHVGNVKGQVFIAVHGKEDIVTEVEFSFNIKENIVSGIPSVDKVKYIRTFDELRERIEERVIKIEEALENGDDYVAQMDSTFQSGMKSLNDRSTQVINEIKTLSDNHKQELNILKDSNITELDDKGNQIKADIEQLNQYDTSNWQKYKLTNDNGTVISLPVGTDMNELKAGMYESSGFINDPLNDAGFYEVIVTESKNSRKVIYATHSYSNRMFVKTIHSGGVERDWKELTNNNSRKSLGTIGVENSEYNDLLTLQPGYYECVIPSDAFDVNAPQEPNGKSYYAEIDVYEGNSGRKQFRLIMSHLNNEYHATVHTDGIETNAFKGWKKVQNEEEYNALFSDTGWIDWNTMNGATKRETDNPNALQCQRRIRTVNGVKIAHLRVNVNNVVTQTTFGSIPADMVPKVQNFYIRTPVTMNPAVLYVDIDGSLKFYNNVNDTSKWLPGHYINGEFSWIIDDIGGGQ